MESKYFNEEKASNSNTSYFDAKAEIGEESSSSKITTSNSLHTKFQDFRKFNVPKRSKSLSLESLSHEHIQVSRSSSVNKAHDIIAKSYNDPQFRKLPSKISSRIGAVQVLPTCNMLEKVNKSHLDSCIISMTEYDQFKTTGHKINTSASNAKLTVCSLNLSTPENDSISAIALPDQDNQRILNKEIHTLRPLENNAKVVGSPESLEVEKSVQNSILAVASDHGVQNVKKQNINPPNVNTNFTHLENQETPITSSEIDKYLDSTLDNGQRITISSEVRYLLSNKNKDTKVVSEPLYEEIEEADNQWKMEKPEQTFSSLNNDDNKEHFMKSLNNLRCQSESEEDSEQKRFERLSNKDINTIDEAFKIEVSQLKDEENDKRIEEIWIKYMDRPLLPLKSNLKQRSSSCTNLVQTFKVFSKRNSADNSRSLEIASRNWKHTKKNLNSEADISKDSQTEESESKGIQPPRKSRIAESLETGSYPWYHQVDAREASRRLLDMEQDGVFLIRPASNPTKHILHTLCVTHNGCVYNMYIRHLQNGYIALGKIKENEKTFSSVLEMIRYHQSAPISIKNAQYNKGAFVYLLITPPK